MEHELYAEAHLADVRRMTATIDGHGWKQRVVMSPYRVAVARALIALANRIVPTAITPAVIDPATAHPYHRLEGPN